MIGKSVRMMGGRRLALALLLVIGMAAVSTGWYVSHSWPPGPWERSVVVPITSSQWVYDEANATNGTSSCWYEDGQGNEWGRIFSHSGPRCVWSYVNYNEGRVYRFHGTAQGSAQMTALVKGWSQGESYGVCPDAEKEPDRP